MESLFINMFVTYVLISSSSGKFYIGQTSNLDKRLLAHNSGFSPYTRNKGPWFLFHSESYDTRAEAISREKFLKSGLGHRWLNQMKDSGGVSG